MTKKSSTKIGLVITTALVVGNMVASGIYMLPVSLAHYGAISLLGWLGSSVGAIFLALLFSRLSKIVTSSSGGPYAYTKAGLGEFAAFLVAWGYWISIWCTNAAITVAFVSYLAVFFPVLLMHSYYSLYCALAAVWILTFVNTRGVRQAGIVQLITTILKLTPLLLIALIGFFYIKVENFVPFNTSDVSNLLAITSTATLTLFAFLGLESATIPSGNIRNPEVTISRATLIGTGITIGIYVMGSVTVMGIIPANVLINSTAPFADAASYIWGNSARYWVAAGALVSTFGALNGWILLQGQIPLAASKDKLFPKFLSKENKNGTPASGIIISSLLISFLLFFNFSRSLGNTFTRLILLATVTSLLSFLFSAASYAIIIFKKDLMQKNSFWQVSIAAIAFFYSLWAIIGCGQESVYWGFIALMLGIPFYAWMKRSSIYSL